MSVILDALKRVQAEDQRRDERPERQVSRPQGSDDALLRRLAEPRAERPESRPQGRSVSPVVWASLAVVVLVGSVALGLWWMAPSFDGPNANEDRPLLADLTGAAAGQETSDAGAGSTGRGAPPARNGDGGTSFGSGSGGGNGEPPYTADGAPAAGMPSEEGGSGPAGSAGAAAVAQGQNESAGESGTGDGPAPIWAPPRGADLSDLSGNVGTSSGSASSSEGESEGFMRFEVADEGSGSRGRQSSGVQIDSSGGTGGQGPSGRSTVPGPLVDPGVRDAFDEGVRLHQMGELHRAEKAYKRALKFDPYNARVNLNLGVLYEQRDELTLAEQHLRAAVSVEPDHANSHNNLGVVLYRMGNYDAALIEFNRALALDPELLDAYSNKGLIFTRWGRFDDAERAFLQVLTLEPQHALSHYNLGLVYEETGQMDKAVQRYETFLRLGAADYPEITAYLSDHLDWLEGRLGTHGSVRIER